MRIRVSSTTFLLPGTILLGLGVGYLFPVTGKELGALIDPLVIILLALLFFEIRFAPLREFAQHRGFISLAWLANFILVPILGWGIASLFFGNQPALFAGLLLYLLLPCTDWFLAFTRIAKGDTALGSVLIPINLISQLLLFPVYLGLFLGSDASVDLTRMWGTFGEWFLFPLIAAILIRLLLTRALPPNRFEPVPRFAGFLVQWVLAGLVFCIFSCHTPQLITHSTSFPLILLAVFIFFVMTSFLSEFLSWRFRLSQPQHVLLSVTTAARNSPLMLGLATIALPDQPVVYAVLIIGMLVEFPHLTFLSRLLLRQGRRITPSGSNPVTTT